MKKKYDLFIIAAFITMPLSSQVNPAEDEILNAYEQRISGNTEQAREILNGILEKDPENAMANFEMARTVPDIEKMKYIDQAITKDPDNPMYEFYRANIHMLNAYIAMHEGNDDKIRENVEKCCKSLDHVLEIKPDCCESLLFLVDLYGTLPAEMGGNKETAKKYLDKIRPIDPLYAAQGELYLAEGGVDMVDHWQTYLDKHGECQAARIKLGKANLMNGNIPEATRCFEEVMAKDASQEILYLHIARAHLYNAMRGGPDSEKEIAGIKENIWKYLDADNEKPVAVEAWCYGWLGMIENKSGDTEQAEKYLQKAKMLMPDFSRATALPGVDDPPNLITYHFSSYFSPF